MTTKDLLAKLVARLRARAEVFRSEPAGEHVGMPTHDDRVIARVLDEVADAIEEALH